MSIGWLEDQVWDGKVLADEEKVKEKEKEAKEGGVLGWINRLRRMVI